MIESIANDEIIMNNKVVRKIVESLTKIFVCVNGHFEQQTILNNQQGQKQKPQMTDVNEQQSIHFSN